jgi:hypothetical protein
VADHGRGRPGWLHTGPLEERLTRAWLPGTFPPAETLLAIMTVAAVPRHLATRLGTHLTGGIVIGPGAVPDLPGFEYLRAVPLPLQAGTWERSAGVYDPERRRIGVGSVASPSVSVTGHELGHAVDHMDGVLSRSEYWLHVHTRCRPYLAPPYRHDPGELLVESFACVLARNALRLIRLVGDRSIAHEVYVWLASRYGIGHYHTT